MSEDWAAYFVDYYARLRAKEAEVDDEPEFFILTPSHPVEAADLPSSARKVLNWLGKNQYWTATATCSVTRHRPVYFKSGDKQGELKTPEHDQSHFVIAAEMRAEGRPVAAFDAHWGTDHKGKPSFDHANVFDVVTKEKVMETAVTPFEDWLRVFAPEGAPKKREPRKPKPTPEEQAANDDAVLLAGADWSA